MGLGPRPNRRGFYFVVRYSSGKPTKVYARPYPRH